jgi:hypothetical protein
VPKFGYGPVRGQLQGDVFRETTHRVCVVGVPKSGSIVMTSTIVAPALHK